MITSPTSSAPDAAAALAAGQSPTAARIPKQSLGSDDFMRLLAVQFQKQDPMKPMEDTTFIAQMAQFSALQQSSALTTSVAEMRSEQNRAVANSYLGRRVTVDSDGQAVTGDVSRIEMSGGSPRLIVAGEAYPLSAVLVVEPGNVSSAPAPIRE